MTDEEKDAKIRELLLTYEPEELKELHADCAEILNSYDLGKCARRLHQIAEHELSDHQCVGSALYLKAVAKRLEWYHSQVLKLQEDEKRSQVIH